MGWLGRRRRRAARSSVPPGFEAVAETMLSGDAAAEGYWSLGASLADAGVSLADGFADLLTTAAAVAQREPTFAEARAFASGWGDATLAYVNDLTCADPLTGLSTQAHLRERVAGLYRGASAGRHALVIAESRAAGDRISAARSMTLLGEAARTVFPAAEAIGQVGHGRVVVLAPRDAGLGPRVSLLRRLAEHETDRVWIEGLPHSDRSAGRLIDELARS